MLAVFRSSNGFELRFGAEFRPPAPPRVPPSPLSPCLPFSPKPMHELALTETLVTLVAEQAQGAPVRRVTLEIGQLSAVLPESMQFCFDVCAQGTPLQGAILEIIEIPGQGRCRDCGQVMALEMPYGVCDSCDSLAIDIIAGQELRLKNMEIALCA